jgi:hypothetical protein
MLESFKRFFSKSPAGPDLVDVSEWAKRCGHGFKRARGDEGFVIDGVLDGKPWRMEWGPPQRGYIEGHELRLRMELELSGDAQMLLLSRPLMDTLERQTFEEFTDNVQTQIGTKTPEEMRWLVMFPKVNLSSLKVLRTRFSAVASDPAAGLAWLEGPLANMLERAAVGFLLDEPPFVLMTLRGRAYLRMQLHAPDVTVISAVLALFETAVAQALQAGAAAGSTDANAAWGLTSSTAWQSLKPVDADTYTATDTDNRKG